MPPALRLIAASAALSLVVTACVTTASGGREEASSTPTPSPTQAQPTSTATPQIRPTSTPQPTATPASPFDPTPTATEPYWRCTPAGAELVIHGLFDAFNTGDWERLRSMLPPKTYQFSPAIPGWRAAPDDFYGVYIQDVEAATSEDFFGWLVRRRTFHERWVLQDLITAEPSHLLETPQFAVIGLQFIRAADDIDAYSVVGKGAVNCVEGTLIFFSGGGDVVTDGVVDRSLISRGKPVTTEIPEFSD